MSEKKRIMIVDDDPKNVKILKMLFQNTADLAVANNGEEALEKIPQFKPNLVLLDLMMPGIEGYEVCQWIKSDERFCNTKVVIVSSRAMNHEFKRGFEVGANEYFSKPFDHDALVARVHELLDESTPEGAACNAATGNHEPTAAGHGDEVMDQGQEPARILIVDDDSRNLKIVKLILMEHNYDLATAETGSETLEKVAEFNPDLILLDVMMPDISGCEVAKRIKGNPATRQIPIIMLTARSDMETLEESFHAGAMDYIRKPFNDRELILRVQNALTLKFSIDENRRWQEQMLRDLDLAGSLQKSILAPQPSYTRHFDAYLALQSSIAVGGDVFDVLDLPDGRSCVYVGDVAGHGVGPAMASCLVKAMLSELLRNSSLVTPLSICRELENRFRHFIPDPSMYMTLFLMILDEANQCWNGLSCGHPPPLVYQNGELILEEQFESTGGLPIGFNTQFGLTYNAEDECQIPCVPGMQIVMFTDGLLEAAHRDTGEMCERGGVDRVFRKLHQAGDTRDMARRLIRAIDAEGYRTEADDCSAITLDFVPINGYACYSISPNTDAVRSYAHRISEGLLEVNWPEKTAHAIELLIVEYINNVIDHSHLATDESIDLVVRQYGDELGLIFSDYGPAWDLETYRTESQQTGSLAMRGRGLAIIEEIASALHFFRIDSQNYCMLNVKRDWQTANETEAVPAGAG